MVKVNLEFLLKKKMIAKGKRKEDVRVLEYCPLCSTKLRHVNALDTEAKIYFVYCPQPKCRYCEEYKFVNDILVKEK
jgi:hypothetical protein